MLRDIIIEAPIALRKNDENRCLEKDNSWHILYLLIFNICMLVVVAVQHVRDYYNNIIL